MASQFFGEANGASSATTGSSREAGFSLFQFRRALDPEQSRRVIAEDMASQ